MSDLWGGAETGRPVERRGVSPLVLRSLVALFCMLAGTTLLTVGATIWLGIGPGLGILGLALFVVGVLIGRG